MSSGWRNTEFGPKKRLTHDSGLFVNLVLPLAVDLPAFRLSPDQLDDMIALLLSAKAACESHAAARVARLGHMDAGAA